MLLAWREKASAQYPGWQHTGSFFIVTTPDGASLPATASEEGFPVLVRFEKGQFDFTQAKADGGDIRFSSEGKPLAYQIETWDAGSQNACVWVRIPLIKGNAQQEIKLYWGKADASSESNGKAVFNESNGYLAVFHMDDPVKDETGSLVAKDLGTTSTPGMVGKSRHFEAGKGINCGENITTFPTGSSPHSTDIWFRADKQPDRIVSWGSGGPKTMVQIMAGRPLHAFIDCYGPAGVRGTSSFKLAEWVHVMHTFEGGASKVYVNGVLEGNVDSKEASMDIKNQVQMFMGGWRSYGFNGDIDEVRVSKVARSANWARLQYENQKSMQTLVGPLVQPGSGLAVSVKSIVVKEGANTVVTARAGGARKLFWFVVKDGQETLAAVDRFDFTLNAGRVTSDQSLTLRLKAVFAEGAKSIDIPVTVQEDIPEPVYTLKAPAKWDGRETIEIVPEFANLNAMQAKGASDVKCNWSVSGIAVVRESAPGKLILKHAQASGKMTVTASLSNGGEAVVRSIDIPVQEPAKDVWVQRIPDKDEKPVDNQFYARDDTNEGTLFCNGTLTDTADSVFLKLFADDKLIKTESQKPKADKSYALSVRLKAGLVRYRVELGTRTGTTETVLHKADNLICGDAYIIDGQSNAVAYNYHNSTQPFAKYTNPWIRTYGGNGEAENPTRGGWGNALIERPVPTSPDRVYFIGAWCMSIARKLVEDEKIPVCMLNGAVGGTRIDQHLPDPVDRLNSTDKAHSIYRNLLRRVVDARLTHGIRGVFWHQGEADQGFDGPDNCFGC